MSKNTRLVRSKVTVVPAQGIAPDPYPLGEVLGGRRRTPAQARSLRTRAQILDAALALGVEHGPGAVTMQMVAKRAGIAAGTAYQFFDDRDAIFFEIYESWTSEFWSRLLLITTTEWTPENWRTQLHEHVSAISRFYYERRIAWPIVRYVESTKTGRTAMRLLLDANYERRYKAMGRLFRDAGKSAAEARRIVRSLVRVARGYHAYSEVTAADVRDIARADEETQALLIESGLRRGSARAGGASALRSRPA